MANTLFSFDDEQVVNDGPVTCLGIHFENDGKRREFFREELRKKLPELRLMEGFPVGEDDDIIALSDPPYYTACPNPWLNDLIKEWESEKTNLQVKGKRVAHFEVKEPYAADVSEGKGNAVYMAHTYHTKVPHPAVMRYILHYTQPGDIIFDGFAGTGMTAVAASVCGKQHSEEGMAIEKEWESLFNTKPKWGVRHAICNDLSPYASLISYNYINPADSKSVKREISRIYSELVDEFGWMYKTRVNGREAKINYVVWSNIFLCKSCGHEINYWKSALDRANTVIKDEFECPACKAMNSKDSNLAYETVYDNRLGESVSQPKCVPVLIVCTTADNKRYEIEPSQFDYDVLSKIDATECASFFPVDRMPEGGESRRNDRIFITNVHQFFTRRNLLVLSALREKIIKSPLSAKLMFFFTSMINRSTKMNRFSTRNYFHGGGGWCLTGLSGTLYMPSLPMEVSVLEQLEGKLGLFDRIAPALPAEHINSSMIGSATKLPIRSDSIDYIFVDPPFGANLMYSELNFIPEAWLKIKTESTKEAIVNPSIHKDLFDYQRLMNESLTEFYRILKPGKWLTMEFSNTSAAVWNSIQNALQGVGFVVTNVAGLDKKQGSFKAVTTTTAVKQDLVITCFKPSETLQQIFAASDDYSSNIWDFVEELLYHLPIHLKKDNSTTAIVERSPKILFDRLIAFYVQHGYPVPIDAAEFQKGLKERFVERDGMFFTAEQAIEYEDKKKETTAFVSLALLVGSEAEGIEWLKRKLEEGPKTYSDILPDWMQDLVKPKKGDTLPELMQILDENFLKDENGYWHIPDLNDQAQLDAVKTKRLLKEFEVYVEAKKVKNARLEALRAGFKECYKNKDFATIVAVGDKIDEELLTTDEVLLRFYDIASSRV